MCLFMTLLMNEFRLTGFVLSLGDQGLQMELGCLIQILILTLLAESRLLLYQQSILHDKMGRIVILLLISIIIVLLVKCVAIFD